MIISSFGTSQKRFIGMHNSEELSRLATSQSKLPKPTIESGQIRKTQSSYKIKTNESELANVEKKLLYYVTAQNTVAKKPLKSKSTAKFSSTIQIDRCRKFKMSSGTSSIQEESQKKRKISETPIKQSLKEWANENVRIQQMVNRRQHLIYKQRPNTQQTISFKRSCPSINDIQQSIYLNRIKTLSAKINNSSTSPFEKQIAGIPKQDCQLPSTADTHTRIKKFCYQDYPSLLQQREEKLNFQMELQILNDDYAFCLKGQENDSVVKLSQIYQNERLNKDYIKRRNDNQQCIYSPKGQKSFQMFYGDVNPQNTEISCENIQTEFIKKRSRHRKNGIYKDVLKLNEL